VESAPLNSFNDESHQAWGNRWLEGRRAHLQPGPQFDTFVLPSGLEVLSSPDALRFKGDAAALLDLGEELRKLERSPSGSAVQVQEWTLTVDDELAFPSGDRVIKMPWHFWGMAAGKFRDVGSGWELNPYDFTEMGYMFPTDDVTGETVRYPRPEIGVIRVGPSTGEGPDS
jgi:hypothetical protein